MGSTVRDPDGGFTAETQTATLCESYRCCLIHQGLLCAFRPSGDAALSLRLKNRENDCL